MTRDGRTLRRREQINRGNAERPLSDAEIVEKFRSNASRALSSAQAQRIESLVLSLDVLADVNQLASGLAAVEFCELTGESSKP